VAYSLHGRPPEAAKFRGEFVIVDYLTGGLDGLLGSAAPSARERALARLQAAAKSGKSSGEDQPCDVQISICTQSLFFVI
jgi:hypothetical protein